MWIVHRDSFRIHPWENGIASQNTRLIDRILLARVLIEHMLTRKETRWPCYHTRLDFPCRNDLEYKIFINSRMDDGRISILQRTLEPPYAIVKQNITKP